MKLLFVQLSDVHCMTPPHIGDTKIEKIGHALRQLGNIDKIALIFTGDLMQSGEINQCKAGKIFISSVIQSIKNAINSESVDLYIVPGNHDIVIPEEGHNSADILKWNKDEMLTSELDRMKAFFEYANQNRCFLTNKLIDNKTLNFDGKKIQITLLNSAPFSTLKEDDKELHHFPQDMEKMLLRQDDSDYKITIIHHSFEWFDWESKAMLKKQMQYDDLVLWGHDHTPEQITMKIGNSAEIDYLVGGEFSLHNNNCSFNAVIINTDDDTIECHTFEWNDNQTLFIPGDKKVISKKVLAMCPSNDYLSKLLVGNKQISNRLTDYYVFPDLIARGDLFNDEDRTEKITEDTIFSKIVTDKIIRITGENHSGKTSLLKYLYSIAVSKGFIPLFLESSSHIESDYNRMLKRLFESQYGDTICFDRYQQEEHSNEIIFIDDLDRISSEKAKNNLINNIRESGRLIIYVSSIDESEFEKSIQDQLDGKTIGTLEIRPFYKEIRDELINKICNIKEATDDVKQITITALDYMVQCQPYLFTLSPGNLIPYIIYILQDKAESHTHNTISMVFETNIRNQLLEYIHDSEMVGYISLLSFIASYMYFESHCDTLSIAEYQLQVEKFNTKRKHHMNAKSFFEACKNAGIFIEEHESFNLKFCDNNILAYFVANSMKRELDNDVTNTEHLQFVVKNICFGINDLIIIFLSYLTKNSNLILQMAVRSFEFLDEQPSWSIEDQNLPFLNQMSDTTKSAPTKEEKQEVTKRTEIIEEKRHEAVKYRKAFDYSEDEVEKLKTIRALKCVQIIGRFFVDQYGDLDADKVDEIIDILYTIPPKIIYAHLLPLQIKYDEMCNSFLQYSQERFPDGNYKLEDIQKMISNAGVGLALDLMNSVAYNSTTYSTLEELGKYDTSNLVQSTMKLMMIENTRQTKSFIDSALKTFNDNQGNYFMHKIIALIARKHILFTAKVDHTQISRLVSGKIFSETNKKQFLITPHKKYSN